MKFHEGRRLSWAHLMGASAAFQKQAVLSPPPRAQRHCPSLSYTQPLPLHRLRSSHSTVLKTLFLEDGPSHQALPIVQPHLASVQSGPQSLFHTPAAPRCTTTLTKLFTRGLTAALTSLSLSRDTGDPSLLIASPYSGWCLQTLTLDFHPASRLLFSGSLPGHP